MERADQRIYLDFNATTPLAPSVYEKICQSLKNVWCNPSSNSDMGRKAKEEIDRAREKIAILVQARPNEIIFTSGGTEANNMAIRSAVEGSKRFVSGKPHIVTTKVEHDATLRLIDHLETIGEIESTRIAVDKTGCLSANEVLASVRENTCLITIMLANNETGIIFPVREIGWELKIRNVERQRCGHPPVLLHTDAAQAVGKMTVSVRLLNVDYLTIVGHKFYGPRIGSLYRNKHAPLIPLLYGGGQEDGFRPGTENTALIAGMGEAAEILNSHLDKICSYMKKIRDYLEMKLVETFGYKIVLNFVNNSRLPNTTSVTFINMAANDILTACKRIVASTGAACHSNISTPSSEYCVLILIKLFISIDINQFNLLSTPLKGFSG
ncbi:hypothetical protein AAG570_000330 [Ranatra chinensis]|uniref:Selenocysteine lyase n=1 Tax=Ranatra chinensis TaxID=642074 RepID=A0ABD0ZDN0_9HEMI